MSVIATDESDQLANYSNYGLHNTDIAAPGSKILSTVLNGQVRSYTAATCSYESCCPCAMYTQMLKHARGPNSEKSYGRQYVHERDTLGSLE